MSIDVNQPIKLVCRDGPVERDVVRFPHGISGAPEFDVTQKMLRDALVVVGFYISLDNGQKIQARRVRLDDPDFGIHFYNVYVKDKLPAEKFIWKPLE